MWDYIAYKFSHFFRVLFNKETESEKCERLIRRFNKLTAYEAGILRPLDNLIVHTGHFTIVPPFFCEAGINISVGSGTFLNSGVKILDRGAKVTIGSNVLIAPNVVITTAHHGIENCKNRGLQFTDIHIGNNVWIGAGAIILPGITIGDGVVIAAGAVVTKNVPSHVLVAGVPAVVKKHYPSSLSKKI